MNWILLFIMLKLLAINWAKPIDSIESNSSELQTAKDALNMGINLTFASIHEANDLNKRLENNIIKSIEIVPNDLTQKPEESSKRSQYVTENSTEPLEVLKEVNNSSNDTQSIISTSTVSTSDIENTPNDSKVSSLNEDIDKNFTATTTKIENDTNVEVKREAEDSLGITTDINTANSGQITQQSENIFEQTTFELTPDTIAETTHATFEMLPENVKNFYNHSQEINENVTEHAKEELEKVDITETTVDNPAAKEFTNLMTASTSEKILIRPLNPIDICNTIAILPSNSEKIPTQENTTGDQNEDSNETTTLKQTVDSLTYQAEAHTEHTESIRNSGDVEVAASSMIQPIMQDANTSTALYEIIEDSKYSTNLTSEEISEQISTLKRAVDALTEKTANEQIESTATEGDKEKFNEEDNLAFAKLNLESIKTENKDDTQETITTTSSVLENLKENEEQETSSASTDFPSTNDNLIETTLSNFEKSETELFSTSENIPKTVTESISENSLEKTSHENLSNSKSPTSTSENYQEVTTNNFKEVSMKTQTLPEGFLISKENVKSDDNNVKNLLLESEENGIQENSKKKTRSEEHNKEEEASTITSQHPETATRFETVMLNDNINGTEIEILEPQETNKVFEIKEDTKAHKINKNTENEISYKSLTPNETSTTTNKITTENYATLSQIAQETTTSDHSNIEETTHEFAKLENKFIEKEKMPSSTLLPSTSITLSVKFTTVSPLEETKVSTEKLQEKLKEAVKVLADEMKKITVKQREQRDQEETTTFKIPPTETTTELVTSFETLREHTTTIKAAADEISRDSFALEKTDDVTTQKSIDELDEELNDSTTVSQIKSQLTESEQIKKSRAILDTTQPAVIEIKNEEKVEVNVNEATTTIDNDVKENIVATTTEDFVATESTNEAEIVTTEKYNNKNANVATLARVSLQKDINNISLQTNIALATEAPTQNLDIATANETHIESKTIMQPTEPIEDAIILTSSEAGLQEHTDSTTIIQPSFEKKEKEVSFRTQSTPTQPSFMEEQQQQVEITTEQNAQTASAATSEQTATTINYEEQQTTEAEIHPTTEEEVDEKTTDAAVESEARSLPLSPPKLEYSQSEDGVEVFYGYSNVNHN